MEIEREGGGARGVVPYGHADKGGASKPPRADPRRGAAPGGGGWKGI